MLWQILNVCLSLIATVKCVEPHESGWVAVDSWNLDRTPAFIAPNVCASLVEENAKGRKIELQTNGNPKLDIEVTRDLTIYTNPSLPDVIVVLNRFVSSEDSIEVYDKRSLGHKPQTIDHGNVTEDYGHLHFEVVGFSQHTLKLKEMVWAGSSPAKSRNVKLTFSHAHARRTDSAWVIEK